MTAMYREAVRAFVLTLALLLFVALDAAFIYFMPRLVDWMVGR